MLIAYAAGVAVSFTAVAIATLAVIVVSLPFFLLYSCTFGRLFGLMREHTSMQRKAFVKLGRRKRNIVHVDSRSVNIDNRHINVAGNMPKEINDGKSSEESGC